MEQQPRSRPSIESTREPTPTTAELCLRNHDAERTYELAVAAVNLDNPTQYQRAYTLQPGDIQRERGLFLPGTYNLAVTLDGGNREAVTCRLSEHPADTVLVECGNGVLSVTPEPY